MKPLKNIASDDLAAQLCKVGRSKVYGSGEEVFAEGDDAEFMPVVLSGRVKVVRFLEQGKELILNIFHEGEMFAIPPVLDGKNYPATAIAMDKSKLLLIYRRDFLRLLKDSPEFSSLTMSRMSELLRETTSSIKNLVSASPEQRIGNVLVRLAKKEGRETPVTISIRRQDIAEMSGLTTETTIRAVRKLADKGLVQIVHGKIIIENVSNLSQHCSD